MSRQPKSVALESNLLLPAQDQIHNASLGNVDSVGRSSFVESKEPKVSEGGGGLRAAIVRAWRRFLALTRLSLKAVCEESAQMGEYDYHNSTDDVDAAPWFSEGCGRCKRCGKRFRL